MACKPLARHDSPRHQSAERWCDRVTNPLLLSEASVSFMPPGEHLDGTSVECAHLHLLLACFRASPPPMRLPGVTGHPLPEILGTGIIDPDVFHTGHAIMAARYEQLGIRALLPLERVRADTRSAARPRHGTRPRRVPPPRPGLPAHPDGRRRHRARRPHRRGLQVQGKIPALGPCTPSPAQTCLQCRSQSDQHGHAHASYTANSSAAQNLLSCQPNRIPGRRGAEFARMRSVRARPLAKSELLR